MFEEPFEIVYSAQAVQERVRDLGRRITQDYSGSAPLLISILKGAAIFLADLIRWIDLPLELDFMAITSYGAAERPGGVVRIIKDLDLPLAGRQVLIVEDIIDTGLTMGYLVKNLRAREPSSLEVCTLLDRRVRRLVQLPIKYVGFEIPDQFLIGYGLDYQQRYRNLPFLARLGPEYKTDVAKSST
jgi:hypoxanthine phosphoribosyltransferase